jgi:3-methyladenine DNA glycosylase AlkD
MKWSEEQWQAGLIFVGRVASITDSSARARETVAAIHCQLQALQVRNTPNVRAVRRAFSHAFRREEGPFVMEVAKALCREHKYLSVAYELISAHRAAFGLVGERELEELGEGLDSWWSVDDLARTLSGPAWREGLVSDGLIIKWAQSPDKWWRRAALVSTVALNVRSRGGRGDTPRTLQICRLLVDDHEDMVEKALSWALRELVVHDAQGVRDFTDRYEANLGSRVRREVHSKLSTGLKSPRRKRSKEKTE